MDRKPPSLSRRLSLWLAAILVVASLLLIMLTYRLAEQDSSRLLNKRSEQYLHFLSDILAEPLWTLNRQAVQDIGASYALNDDVAAIVISSNYDALLYEQRNPNVATSLTRSKAIEYNGEELGEVRIELTNTPYLQRTREMLQSMLVNLGITILLVLSLTAFLVRSLLKKPLAQLESIVTSFAEGRHAKAPPRSFKEFKPTLEATAAMAERITSQMNRLRMAEEKYRGIFEKATEGIFQTSLDGRLLAANPAMADMLGYASVEELHSSMGKHVEDAYVDPLDRTRLLAELQAEKVVVDFEAEFRRKDASVFFGLVNARMTAGHDGGVIIDGRLQDITVNKEKEKAVQEKMAAESASEAKSKFLANMSHEIRTPLNGILGMLQLMQTGSLDAEQKEYLERAITSSRRLNTLLTDILDLARVEAGKLRINAEPFNLKDALERVVELFAPVAKAKGLELRLCFEPPGQGMVLGDAQRLEQVLGNLTSNAIKFTDHGQVVISAHPVFRGENGECRVLFSVADTGIGIADDTMHCLFVPFAQAEDRYELKIQGTGLGLSICKHLVRLMGGNISFESREGEGSTFYCCIPFATVEEKSSSRADHAEAAHVSGLKVLVADDDDISRAITIRFMEKSGNRAVAAKNGEEALGALQRERFDLVLMDVQMPLLDGLSATRAIRSGRAGPGNQDVPIIAMTAYAMTGDKESFIEAGMNGYVAKPVDMKKLLARVDTVMQGRGAKR